MVHNNRDGAIIRGPYQEVRKEREQQQSSQQQQERRQPQSQSKSDNKYGSWGPVYKNKEHFVGMHIC